MRAEYARALTLAKRTEEVGAERNDLVTLSWGYSMQGYIRFFLGELVAARACYERCQELGDPRNAAISATTRGRETRRASWTLEDSHFSNQSWLALGLAYLGFIDQGRTRMSQALAAVRQPGQVDSLASVLSHASWMGWLVGSADQEQQQRAEELLALMNEHGFPHWLGWGMLYRGRLLTALGQTAEGFKLLTKGLAALRDTGAVMSRPYALMMLAETCLTLRQMVESENCLAEAERIIETTGERCNESELCRLRGDLFKAVGDEDAAEGNSHRALAVARTQSARTFELRAATSLAQLWRDRGKSVEARDLLAPVTAGSPRASTRRFCKMPKRCLMSCRRERASSE